MYFTKCGGGNGQKGYYKVYVKFNGKKYRVEHGIDTDLMGFILRKKLLDAMPKDTQLVGCIHADDNNDCYAVIKKIPHFKYFMFNLFLIVLGIALGIGIMFGYYKYRMSGLDLHATYQSNMIYDNGKVDAYITNYGKVFDVYLNVDGVKSESIFVTKRDTVNYLNIELEEGKTYEGTLVFEFEDNTKISRSVTVNAEEVPND